MSAIERSIEIDVPVRTAYNQWTQFESFPAFMDDIETVGQIDDTRLRWVGDIAGQRREWYAKITEQTPDQRIAWTAEGDIVHSGVVTFHRLDDDRSKVMLQMEYDPKSWGDKAAEALGLIEHRVKKDLENFKRFIEERGSETGAWRGEVEQKATK